MFENIKSLHISKNIFCYLNQRIKLNIIQYNKSLQNLQNINIIDYRILSGKYIVYEKYDKNRKGKGKLYDTCDNTLLFEGEFLESKKMERGKNTIKMEKSYLKVII